MNDDWREQETSAPDHDDVEIRLTGFLYFIARGLGRWYGGTINELSEAKVQRRATNVRKAHIDVHAERWRGRIIAFRGAVDLQDLKNELSRHRVRVPWALIVVAGRDVTHAAIAFAPANFIQLFRYSDVMTDAQKSEVAWEATLYSFTLVGGLHHLGDGPRDESIRDFTTNKHAGDVLVRRPAEAPITLHQLLGELVKESGLSLSVEPVGMTVEFERGTVAVDVGSDLAPVALVEIDLVAMAKQSKQSYWIDTSSILRGRLTCLDGSSPDLDVSKFGLVERALNRNGSVCPSCWKSHPAAEAVAMPIQGELETGDLLAVTPAPPLLDDITLVCPNCAESLKEIDADAMSRRAQDASIPLLNVAFLDTPRIAFHLHAVHRALQPKLPKQPSARDERSRIDQLESELRALVASSSTREVIDAILPALTPDTGRGEADVRYGLKSPLKQYTYLAGLLSASREPREPIALGSLGRWQIRFLLESIVEAYIRDYGPAVSEQFASGDDERNAEVAILAFLDSYCSVSTLTCQAGVERLLNLSLYHPEALPHLVGLSLVELLTCALAELRKQTHRLFDAEVALTWAIATAREGASCDRYHRLWDARKKGVLYEIELSDTTRLKFRECFGLRRGEQGTFRSFGSESPAETRPLFIFADGTENSCHPLLLLAALERVVERALRKRFKGYLKRKGDVLEYQVRETLRRVFSPEAITEHVFLQRGSHERDFVVVSGNIVLCIEAKAVQRKAQPIMFHEAIAALRKNFSDGPEYALLQAQEHALALEQHRTSGRPLYDAEMNQLGALKLPSTPRYVHIAVTAEDYGILAERPHLVGRAIPPMSVILSANELELLVDTFSFTGWSGHALAHFFEQRARHAHLARAESIQDWAAVFIERGGTLDGYLREGYTRLLVGGDQYFGKIYHAMLMGEDPASIKHDIREYNATEYDVWGPDWWKAAKISASDLCPCGSGRSAGDCHGVIDEL